MKSGKLWMIAAGAVLVCSVAGVVGLFAIVRGVAKGLTSNQTQAARIGHQIVEYSAPDGYAEVMGMDLFGAKVVALQPTAPAREGVVLSLMELPVGATKNKDQAERRMRAMWARRAEHRVRNPKLVGSRQATIRGQSIRLALLEGQAEKGGIERQLYGAFPGERGATVTFMALGRADTWNQQVVDQFLASIR